jgi:hypothetical protein
VIHDMGSLIPAASHSFQFCCFWAASKSCSRFDFLRLSLMCCSVPCASISNSWPRLLVRSSTDARTPSFQSNCFFKFVMGQRIGIISAFNCSLTALIVDLLFAGAYCELLLFFPANYLFFICSQFGLISPSSVSSLLIISCHVGSNFNPLSDIWHCSHVN